MTKQEAQEKANSYKESLKSRYFLDEKQTDIFIDTIEKIYNLKKFSMEV